MEDISRHKEALRSRQQELRALLNEWNPIGISGLPTDEYDCLIPIVGWLRGGMTEAELAARMSSELVDHFGLDPEPHISEDFARRVFAWYWLDPLPGSVRAQK